MELEQLTIIPYSTIFILLITFTITFATSITNRRLTNIEQLKAWNKEITAWRSDSMKATRTGDKKLMAKVKKQQQQVMQLQSKMMWNSMKNSLIWTIPLLLLWWFFLTPFFSKTGTVAYLPWFGDPFPLSYVLWYILCSFLFSTLFNRLLGLGMGSD
jgi:uncharacterized membrane protein (DUF106 family)